MKHIELLKELSSAYENDENILQYLKRKDKRELEDTNYVEDIMISYDFQAGNDVKVYYENKEITDVSMSRLAQIIDNFDCHKKTLLEVGVGEGTALIPLMNKLQSRFEQVYGIDISWSRVRRAQMFVDECLKDKTIIPQLLMADMFRLPFGDNSVNIVYTSYAVEPNGGREKEALQELYRVTKDYLVLVEPSYDRASSEGKQRMQEHGYVKGLYRTAKKLGYNVILNEDFVEKDINPLNPSRIMIIEKRAAEQSDYVLCCPNMKTKIELLGNTYFSPDSFLSYPIINGVPCLLANHAVVTTKAKNFYKSKK